MFSEASVSVRFFGELVSGFPSRAARRAPRRFDPELPDSGAVAARVAWQQLRSVHAHSLRYAGVLTRSRSENDLSLTKARGRVAKVLQSTQPGMRPSGFIGSIKKTPARHCALACQSRPLLNKRAH